MSEKLSNKELKELKKKEKAARRAAQKGDDAPAAAAGGSASSGSAAAPSTSQIKKSINKPIKAQTVTPSLFSHLTTREQRIADLPLKFLGVIHPQVLRLAENYSNFTIIGSMSRCKAMLEAFKVAIEEYQTPENITFGRSLTTYLNHQIDFLKNSRPLSVTMGNAIRWLKQEISLVSIDTKELEAKQHIIDKIDLFINEKMEYAGVGIVKHAVNHITENSTLLTFGHSQVLERLFEALADKNITVIIVDSRPLFEGKKLLTALIDKGIHCKYYLISALSNVLAETKIDCVFLGAHAMLSNGRLSSRVGTAMIAMMARKKNIPVLVCCEYIKFSEKIQLDSVTQNELGDCDVLMTISNEPPKKKNFALEKLLAEKKVEKKKGEAKEARVSDTNESPLKKELGKSEYLKVLNIMYDLTPPQYINKVITELGVLPPSSVPVILREYKGT